MEEGAAAWRRSMEHGGGGCSMEEEDAAWRRRMQHGGGGGSMEEEHGAWRGRMQHGGGGCSMEEEDAAWRRGMQGKLSYLPAAPASRHTPAWLPRPRPSGSIPLVCPGEPCGSEARGPCSGPVGHQPSFSSPLPPGRTRDLHLKRLLSKAR